MNNRYMCRGKRKDNGEWIEGYYVCNGEHCYIFSGKLGIINKSFDWERYEVIPETVEQCSGVPDKNGKLMYTGDIINALLDFGMPIKSVCAFRDGSFGLLAKQHGAEHFHPFTSLCNISYEIIGNIHDNKELLDWSDTK